MSGREGKGKKSGRGRGHNRTYLDRGQTKKSSPIKIRESDEGIPILFPPQSSHHDATRNGVQVVKEKLIRYLSKEYGRYGRFMVEDEYYIEEDPVRP